MSGSLLEARPRAGFFACVLLVLLTGCAQLVPQTIALRTDWPQDTARTVELKDVPFFPQDDYQCGPAALATVMNYAGVKITPEDLVKDVYLPSRHGSLQLEMMAAPRRHGLVTYRVAARYADVLREVAAGNPVIILQDVNPFFTQWHYSVINGFDYPSGTVYMRSGTKERQEIPFTALEREWMKSDYWAMVVTPADRIPASANEDQWVSAVVAMARTGPADAVTAGYAAALGRWPGNLPASIGLADQYHSGGAYGLAVNVLRKAQQRHPESVIVANNLAQALSDQGKDAEALAVIDKASDPLSPFASDVRATRQMIEERIAQQKTGIRR